MLICLCVFTGVIGQLISASPKTPLSEAEWEEDVPLHTGTGHIGVWQGNFGQGNPHRERKKRRAEGAAWARKNQRNYRYSNVIVMNQNPLSWLINKSIIINDCISMLYIVYPVLIHPHVSFLFSQMQSGSDSPTPRWQRSGPFYGESATMRATRPLVTQVRARYACVVSCFAIVLLSAFQRKSTVQGSSFCQYLLLCVTFVLIIKILFWNAICNLLISCTWTEL